MKRYVYEMKKLSPIMSCKSAETLLVVVLRRELLILEQLQQRQTQFITLKSRNIYTDVLYLYLSLNCKGMCV